MIGALILIFVIVIGIPVGFLMLMSFTAAAFGQVLTLDGEDRHEGSELIALNK